jgi:hypothetical protein
MNSYFTRLGQEFDSTMYKSDSTYFGDPLVMDPLTDKDQRLSMVFTPSIPTGIAGFVTSCDLFQRDSANLRSSNFGEYFYAFVPTAAGTGFSANTADFWLREIRETVVHEVKHLASIGAHLVNDANSLEEVWLEEGTAFHAEEVWMRNSIYKVPWKGNSRYAATLYCDVRPTFPQCTGAPFGTFDQFSILYDYLDSPGSSSLFGRVADNDFNFYGSAWSFVRWAIDRYAASEVAFLHALTQSAVNTGTANIVAQTNQPVDLMLGLWTLSLYLDDAPGVSANVDYDFPTWNTRDIYAGMNSDFPASNGFPRAFPLIPQTVSMGTFAFDNVGIHAGSFAMYDLSGTTTIGQALGIAGSGGSGPAASTLRIAIARIQ